MRLIFFLDYLIFGISLCIKYGRVEEGVWKEGVNMGLGRKYKLRIRLGELKIIL